MNHWNKYVITLIIVSISFSACKAQTKQKPSDIDLIFQVFFKWKNEVLDEGIFVETCPTIDEFEEITDTLKYKQLSNANIFPKTYNVSFGNYNNDNRVDALFFFDNSICFGNAIGAYPPWLYNRPNYFVLVTSNYEGYRISSKEIDVNNITIAIQKKIGNSSVSVSFEKIEGKGLISGTFKAWPDENSNNYEGLCCPDKLYFFQVDIDNRKISIFISDSAKESYDIVY